MRSRFMLRMEHTHLTQSSVFLFVCLFVCFQVSFSILLLWSGLMEKKMLGLGKHFGVKIEPSAFYSHQLLICDCTIM